VSDSSTDELRRLVRARSLALSESALQSGGLVPADAVQELDRLVKLIDLRTKVEPAPAQQRSWYIAALLVTTLLVVSVLLFARVRETAIELEVKASEVAFSLPVQQVLLERVEVSHLGAAGLSAIDLSDVADSPDARNSGEAGDQQIEIAAIEDGKRRGSVVLKEIAPPSGTEIGFGRGDAPGQYRLRLATSRMGLSVAVHGPVQLRRQRVDFASPRSVELEAGAGTVDLDLTFRDAKRTRIVPQIRIDKLSLIHVSDRSRDLSSVRALSTILSGTLYFESLNGVSRGLRAGEILRLEQPRGEIRSLRLDDDVLVLDFQGRVRGITGGSDDNRQNLMPTWLDWLRAQHGLSLLWGTTFYLFGLALAALRWFKVPM
jgi:hypothetical protein